jgi:hypothetical protein
VTFNFFFFDIWVLEHPNFAILKLKFNIWQIFKKKRKEVIGGQLS